MSQILKAKNRILSRSKHFNEQQTYQNENYRHFQEDDPIEQNSRHYPKKFNISSISMRFQRDEQESQRNSRRKSPQMSRTQRINSIRHFQPLNTALSESNSQSSLRKFPNSRSRKISAQREKIFHNGREQTEKPFSVRYYGERDDTRTNQSPIQRIRNVVHKTPINLLVAKLENPRSQSPYKPRECIRQEVQKHLILSKKNNMSYIDDQFPPKQTIIFTRKCQYLEEGLTFQRLSRLYQNEDRQIVLIKDCEPTNIRQGKMTNPYVYSAISILAEIPERVLPLFQNQQVNQSGSYFVRLCKDGTWRYITLDDYIPIKISLKTQYLGLNTIDKGGSHEIWPSLVEKAMAKVYLNYSNLSISRQEGICPIFRLLTGLPVSKYDLIKDVRSYLVLIDSALKRGHIVIVERVLPQFEQLAQARGFSIEESYRILQIGRNAFTLRNLADIELQTVLSFEEIMMFSSLLIFRKQNNYQYISQKLRHKRGYFSTLKVTVPKNSLCYWDIWQNNPGYYQGRPSEGVDYQIAPFKLLLQPIQCQSSSQYDSKPQQEVIVESGKEISLKKGTYNISIHLCQKIQRDYTLSYYGKQDVQIERVKNAEQWSQQCICLSYS